MSFPIVTGIMLVNGRPQMTARAVQSFLAQTYPRERRYLIIWDTGEPKYAAPFVYDPHGVEIWHRGSGATIGALRNAAIEQARGEIIATFDSDDVSHPARISEQVSLLQSSGSEAVGYNRALFWEERNAAAWEYGFDARNYALGASTTFWRRTWERVPFDDINHGEDRRFVSKIQALGVSSIGDEPRVIFSIHGGNTSVVKPEQERACFKRAAHFDAYCRNAMRL